MLYLQYFEAYRFNRKRTNCMANYSLINQIQGINSLKSDISDIRNVVFGPSSLKRPKSRKITF